MKKIDVQIDFSEDDVHVFTEHANSNEWFEDRIIQEIMKMGYSKSLAKKALKPKSHANTGLAWLAGPLAWYSVMKSIRHDIGNGKRTIKMVLSIPDE